MNILHIDSSILGSNSASRALSAGIVARLKDADLSLSVTYLDLDATPLDHLSSQSLGAVFGGTDEVSQKVLKDFLDSEIIVVGVAFYNFTISSQLKAWVDRILIPSKTFRYTEKGPEGLAGEKRVYLAIARGGLYGPGAPAAALEHAESYLRGVFALMGITQPQVIIAEGLRLGPDEKSASLAAAESRIAEITSRNVAI